MFHTFILKRNASSYEQQSAQFCQTSCKEIRHLKYKKNFTRVDVEVTMVVTQESEVAP
jgi:hypothetical protein